MANAILAYGNLADSVVLSGGSWLAGLPLTNLQNRQLGKVARSSSPAAVHTTFDIEFPANRLLRTVALVNHNLTLTARYRVRFSMVADFSTSVSDSGWIDVWPVVYPLGSLPWGAPNWWSGRYAEGDIATYTGTLIHLLPRSTNARYIRLELSDEANPAGYVELGRLFTADGWQPVRNMAYGASIAWESRSEVQEALSGAEYFNERTSARVVRFELPAMSENEALASAFEIQRTMGVTQEVLFVWDPDDTVHALRRQFLGRLRTLNAIENPGPNRWRSPFEIKELL